MCVKERKPTVESDVYSLSMVIVEVRLSSETLARPSSDSYHFQLASDDVPYPRITDPDVIILLTPKGHRPPKPYPLAPGITSAAWRIAEKCWHQRATEQPEVKVVLQSLENPATPGGCAREACSCVGWEIIDLPL